MKGELMTVDELDRNIRECVRKYCGKISPEEINGLISEIMSSVLIFANSSIARHHQIEETLMFNEYRHEVEAYFTAITAEEIAVNPILKTNMRILEEVYRPRLEIYSSIFENLGVKDKTDEIFKAIEKRYQEGLDDRNKAE